MHNSPDQNYMLTADTATAATSSLGTPAHGHTTSERIMHTDKSRVDMGSSWRRYNADVGNAIARDGVLTAHKPAIRDWNLHSRLCLQRIAAQFDELVVGVVHGCGSHNQSR
jgi:hypothetical protein